MHCTHRHRFPGHQPQLPAQTLLRTTRMLRRRVARSRGEFAWNVLSEHHLIMNQELRTRAESMIARAVATEHADNSGTAHRSSTTGTERHRLILREHRPYSHRLSHTIYTPAPASTPSLSSLSDSCFSQPTLLERSLLLMLLGYQVGLWSGWT